jgi:hypothetical protein
VTALRFVAAIVLALFPVMTVQADPLIHRSGVAAGEAIPTGGSFSIVFPVAFSDMEISVEDPPAPALVTHLLTGRSADGLRVSATEMSGPKLATPIDGLMEAAKARPGTTVSDVSRTQTADVTTLSFALTEPQGGSYFRVIRAHDTQYVLVIQFPETIRDKAALMRDSYFGSFRMTHP